MPDFGTVQMAYVREYSAAFGVPAMMSEKHLARYVDEAAFRLNEGNVKVHNRPY